MSTQNGKLKVVIRTLNYQITGEIHLLPGCRLTDYMTEAKPFIALINARVTTHEGSRVFDTRLLNINSRLIEIITPSESLIPAEKLL